jgi:hypothetical protein
MRSIASRTNINQIPICAGSIRREDPTVPATATNLELAGRLLRPIQGYSDILRIETNGWQTHDSFSFR